MEKILILYSYDIKQIVADHCGVSIENVSVPSSLQVRVSIGVDTIEGKPQAYWKYWPGWSGNHDKRIDDATCSNCGFKHPTVRGSNAPDLLYKVCPGCGKRMGHKEV